METGQVMEFVSRRIVRTRGVNSYNLNANDTAPDEPTVNPEFSSKIFSAVRDSATDAKKLRLIPPGDMDSLTDLKHGESLNIRFIDGAIGDSYTEFGQAIYNIYDKNGEQIVDAIAAGDIMPFIFDKNNKQFKLRFTINSHPRIHDGNATVNPGDETVHDGNYVDVPDSPFIEYSGEDNLTYENSLFCNSRSFSMQYNINTASGDRLERIKNATQCANFNILNSRNGIFVRNKFSNGNKFKLYNKSDNNFIFTDNLYYNKATGLIYNNAYISVNGMPIVDKNFVNITAKQMLQLFNNKEYIELTYKSINSQQLFVYNEALRNTANVYVDGAELDIIPDSNMSNKHIPLPNPLKYYNGSPYMSMRVQDPVVYYDKLPNTILTKEDLYLAFLPYVVLAFKNSIVYLNSGYPLTLQKCKLLTDTPTKDYIKLLDLFNADNVFGKFLRTVTGFFVINSGGQTTITFAYPETYGEFIRYLIQEKIMS